MQIVFLGEVIYTVKDTKNSVNTIIKVKNKVTRRLFKLNHQCILFLTLIFYTLFIK